MTKDLNNIKIGDLFYVNQDIYKMSFGPKVKCYLKDRFYKVLNVEVTDSGVPRQLSRRKDDNQLSLFESDKKIREKFKTVRLTTTSEIGSNNKIHIIRRGDVQIYMKYFEFVEKELYDEISNVEFFDSI